MSEKALEHVPYRSKTVTTPLDVEAKGKEFAAPVSRYLFHQSWKLTFYSVFAEFRFSGRKYLPVPQLPWRSSSTLSGGLLEKGLRRVLNNIPIGSLLVQSSDIHNGEPLLLLSFPNVSAIGVRR
jgi:uridine kinase